MGAALAGCSSSGSVVDTTVSPPVLHTTAAPTPTSLGPTPIVSVPPVTEAFTVLPCPSHTPDTTLEIEGCAEHQIVALDRRIDAAARRLLATMSDSTGRGDFAAAQQAWISYRHAECLSESDPSAGGTLGPVAFAQCEVRIDQQRLHDLETLVGEASP
jgi:uncharacterized protein YecT (DUF1311 family)